MNYKYGKQTLLRVSVTIESLYLYRIYDVIYYGTYIMHSGALTIREGMIHMAGAQQNLVVNS